MSMQQDVIEADFIVVGAGSAGCVMAARLSEDPTTSVVLVEAGGDDWNRWIHIPLGFGKTFADPSVNWCYETEPDAGAGGRKIFWPRGKVLGGSSSINGMVYIRGQHEDFDLWRQMGCTGWSAQDVLPYFKRAEHQTRGADDWHATGGPLVVSDVQEGHPLCAAFIHACNDLGFPTNRDFNGASQDGVGYHQTTTRNGRRCSTAVGYLKPATQRRNLRVVTGALAERIIFDGRRAVGVAFRQDGFAVTARARREVILCGGAINSPQLLLLSGVGPQQHLTDLGIPVMHHLPGVGQAMQDHYSAPIKLKCRYPITVNDIMLSPLKMLHTGLEYYLGRRGAMAAISAQVALFARTRPELATPDVKMSISIFSADRPQDGLHKFSGFTIIVYQLRPESRGEIRLKSPHPRDAPAILANYLVTETDRRTITDGLFLGRRLLATPHLQHYVAEEFLPGPNVQTDAQMLEHARNRGGTVFHPTSTCKMGIDPMAVVDPELRVHGIGGLRVVDASVMPTVVSGNTNAATIMIGEKAADLVRAQMRLAA
jgi:choline dehydrogenase-like flavoprotein